MVWSIGWGVTTLKIMTHEKWNNEFLHWEPSVAETIQYIESVEIVHLYVQNSQLLGAASHLSAGSI